MDDFSKIIWSIVWPIHQRKLDDSLAESGRPFGWIIVKIYIFDEIVCYLLYIIVYLNSWCVCTRVLGTAALLEFENFDFSPFY